MKNNGNAAVAVVLVVGIFLAVGVVASAMNLITIPWLKFNRQVQTERGIIEKTYNADNALYNYRWFKDKHEDIKATERKIEMADQDVLDFESSAGSRSTWTFEDKNEHARLVSIRSGLKNYYETIVGEYNSRAKQVDRNIFQDELPTFFTIKPF